MAEQRRRSFDEVLKDALAQWTKKFERALEEQRQVIGHEAQQRSSDIERAALEYLEMLEHAATEKNAEIHRAAAAHREATERAVAARSAELEQAARQQRDEFEDAVVGRSKELDSVVSNRAKAIVKMVNEALQELDLTATSEVRRIEKERTATRDQVRRSTAKGAAAFEEFAGKRLGELEDALRSKVDGFRRELIDDARRVWDATAEQVDETRSLVTSEGRRLEEQAAATHDDMRRVAAEQAVAFDELAGGRVAELQDALRHLTELLGEFTRLHGSTSNQFDEVSALSTEAMLRLSELDAAVARQIRANEESAAAATEAIKQTSSTEVNRLQQRTIALDERARTHIADLERLAGELFELETSAAEALRELERQVQSGRAEIEALVDDRSTAVRQYVHRAEDAMVQRITELDARAEEITQALDVRLTQAADERAKELGQGVAARASRLEASLRAAVEEQTNELQATAASVKSELRAERRADGSVARATDARMRELAEMVAAAQVALDQIARRLEALEAIAGAADRRRERRRDVGVAPSERAGSQAPAIDRPAPRGPKRNAANTPDLRKS